MTLTTPAAPRRIAVIGGGISGLAAARLLSQAGHRIVLFEAEARLGGHARTIIAGKRGDQPVDTGFIVFNRVNYPNLCALFQDLSVPVAPSDMSFGASIDGGRLEYGFGSLGALFAQKRNAFDPRYMGMLRDIFRFNARARKAVDDPAMPLGGLLDRLGTGAWFRDYYLLPLTGAIWSTPVEKALDFPAEALVRFFDNHALLSHTGQHQWYTVQGGSVEYVRRLERALVAGGVELRMFTPVQAVRRNEAGVEIKTHAAPAEAFDEVVFATHSDDSLRLLADPAPEERRALAAIGYQPNRAVLHADTAVMPRRKAAWASWVYTEAAGQRAERIGLTYWMNSLQPIPKDDPLFVTLNSNRTIREDLIFDEVTFRHPVFDVTALAAQDRIRALNGRRATWFCGAWMRNGFHEDGFASAVDVVTAMARRDASRRVAA
jgi:predicted NAD/FAD-binding protein